MPGLLGPVTVLRDREGVPRIFATNAADGGFAVGFVRAQDRLWQMDVQSRAAAGRLSEVFGPEFIETDTLFRTLGLSRNAANAAAERRAAGIGAVGVALARSGWLLWLLLETPAADVSALILEILGQDPGLWGIVPLLTVVLGALVGAVGGLVGHTGAAFFPWEPPAPPSAEPDPRVREPSRGRAPRRSPKG